MKRSEGHPAWADTVSPSTPFTSPGKPGKWISTPASSNYLLLELPGRRERQLPGRLRATARAGGQANYKLELPPPSRTINSNLILYPLSPYPVSLREAHPYPRLCRFYPPSAIRYPQSIRLTPPTDDPTDAFLTIPSSDSRFNLWKN